MVFFPGDHIFISRGLPSLGPSLAILHHAIVVATIDAHQVEIVEYGVYNPKDGTKKWVAGTGLDHGLLLKEVGEVKRRTIHLQQEPGWDVATNLSDAYKASAVVARALFLLENPSLLPPYHLTNSNGECVARWCKTGRFESSQAKGLFEATDKVVAAVKAVSAMVGNRQQALLDHWSKTNETLDMAFAQQISIKK